MKERIRIINTEGKARRGEIHTPHGVVQTPAFMNVATCGAIKGAVSALDLKRLKVSGTVVQYVSPAFTPRR